MKFNINLAVQQWVRNFCSIITQALWIKYVVLACLIKLNQRRWSEKVHESFGTWIILFIFHVYSGPSLLPFHSSHHDGWSALLSWKYRANKSVSSNHRCEKGIILHQPVISAFDFCFGVDGCSLLKKVTFVWNHTLLLKFDGTSQTSWTIEVQNKFLSWPYLKMQWTEFGTICLQSRYFKLQRASLLLQSKINPPVFL